MDAASYVREISNIQEKIKNKTKKIPVLQHAFNLYHKCCFQHLICKKYSTELNKISYSVVEESYYAQQNDRQIHQILIYV